MVYTKRSVNAPRSTGVALRLLVGLTESGLTGGMMARIMFPKVGISLLRETEAGQESAVFRTPGRCPPSGGAASADGTPLTSAAAFSASPTGLPLATSAEIVEAYQAGRTTPVELAKRLLAGLADLEGGKRPLRLFISQNPEDLLAQAEASALRYRQGSPLGPLDGVPVAVKDELNQAGYPTTVGTRFLGATGPAAADATAVRRFREAGALLVGKTNMHEIGIGVTGLNPHHGAVRNPYNTSCATGGSSSGSAAAVAAGICPIAVGADGGGSIRIPAALCGVFGLKPTFGRVSEAGVAPVCWSVAHAGPLAVSARDLAMAYAVMAGADPADPLTLGLPPVTVESPKEGLKGVRLGVFRPWFEDASPDVVRACQQVIQHLERAGANVVDIEIPGLELVAPVHVVTIVGEMMAAMAPHYVQHRKDFGLDTRLNLALGRQLRADDFIHAQRLRNQICERFLRVMQEVDLIVSPTTAITAPEYPEDALPYGESDVSKTVAIMRFAQPGNLTGFPAVSVPAGYDDAGKPVGFQAMARPFEESLLLRLAAVVEAAVPLRAPSVHASLLG